MTIGFCLFKYFPHGGIQRDMMKIAKECLRRGYAVRVYVIRWNAELPEDIDVQIVPVDALTNHRLYERYAEWVHAHLARHPVDLLMGMVKMPGLDVYYAGDSCYEEKARTQRNGLYRLLPRYEHFSRFERSVFDRSADTQILTISDVQTPFFRKHYQTPVERFHPLPPGIDPDRIAPANTTQVRRVLRTEFGLPEDDNLLLFVGSGFIKKGLDRALIALKALPAALYACTHLLVIGNDNAEPFRRMAVRLGVIDRVRFLTGRDDIPRFLFAADGFLLPAYDENAGMVILEAMIAGVPALVTKNCGYSRFVEEADAGVISAMPFQQADFNKQLVELLTSPRREEWRTNGLKMAENPEIFQLASRTVDYLEAIHGTRRKVIAFTLFKYFAFGGLQRDFLRVARTCLERGYRVRAYTLFWEGEIPQGIDVIEVPVSAVTNHTRYQRFARWVAADLRWRPAACVVGFNKMPGLDVYYAADSCYEEKAQQLRAPLYRYTSRYRLFSRFERAVFDPQENTLVLLITEVQKAAFQRFYSTPDERFRLLPPGVSLDRKPTPDADRIRCEFRSHYEIAEDEVLLLLIGSGFITKGLDRALLALAALPGELKTRVRLFVIGQDNPRQFLSLAEELSIDGRVTIFAGRDDIPSFLQGADLLIHPAIMESGGIVLLEAMIAGLPVVATDICGFSPYVREADAGVLIESPFRQSQLNDVLRSLIENENQRQIYSSNGLRFGETADIYHMADRAVDLIQERIRGDVFSA
jgi:UDP-glucose:(heptosyl)LPS alpha-1,3-glucosyltransferase